MNRRLGFTMVELVVLSGTLGVIATVSIPGIFEAREASRRASCSNVLKAQAIAMHNYNEVFNAFPPGWVQHSWEADEGDAWGWGAMLLPYLDEAPRYNRIDFHVPPSQQVAAVLESIMHPVPLLRCPSANDADGWMTSHYAMSFGPQPPPRWEPGTLSGDWPGDVATPKKTDGMGWCNSNRCIADITDGTSNTILIGERSRRSSNALWLGVHGNQFEYDAVSDLGRHSPLNGSPGSFSSLHQRGAHFAFGDGAVRFLSERINDSPPDRNGVTLSEKLSNRSDALQVTPEEYRLLESEF